MKLKKDALWRTPRAFSLVNKKRVDNMTLKIVKKISLAKNSSGVRMMFLHALSVNRKSSVGRELA